MPRSLDQNALFNVWCREISVHLRAVGINQSEDVVRELIKQNLGNVRKVEIKYFENTTVAMSTTKYKKHENELTAHDLRHGLISMDCLLIKMQAWASADLMLELKSTNE